MRRAPACPLCTFVLSLILVGCGGRTGAHGPSDTGVVAPRDSEEEREPVADAGTEVAVAADAGRDRDTPLAGEAGASADGASPEAGSIDEKAADASVVDGGLGSEATVDACTFVDNATFIATQMDECGVLANGQFVGCYWTLVFQNDGTHRRACWTHSDLLEDMTYQCDGWIITAKSTGFALSYQGTYDPVTGTLHWEQKEYVRSSVDAAGPQPINYP